jgi:drug/metabolite transporter (DMT)-like permease
MIRWAGTFLCLAGIALTSLNIFPLNLLFGLVGSLLWTIQGYLYKDYALLTVELVAVAIYILGVIKVFI